jgi:hypothetical protein
MHLILIVPPPPPDLVALDVARRRGQFGVAEVLQGSDRGSGWIRSSGSLFVLGVVLVLGLVYGV